MKKTHFVKSLKEGNSIETIFLVVEKELRQKKDGRGDYLYLVLRDKTGKIPAFMWDNFENIHKKIEPGILIKIKGNIQSYKDKLQIVLQNLEVYREEAQLKDFLPSTDKDIEVLYRKVLEKIDSLSNEKLKELLKNIYSNPEYRNLILQVPAAKGYHHACIGGLLEHTVSLLELAELILQHYRDLNRDLLLSGVLLHDIGKIYELDTKNFFEYTKAGRMVGHITMGAQLLEKEANNIDNFPSELKNLLTHMIISHHGQLEYGSPKEPMIKEALALHFIDLIDSALKGFNEIMEQENSGFSYSQQLGRFIFKTE